MTTATPHHVSALSRTRKALLRPVEKVRKAGTGKDAFARGTGLWTLGGSVLEAWLAACCPDFGL